MTPLGAQLWQVRLPPPPLRGIDTAATPSNAQGLAGTLIFAAGVGSVVLGLAQQGKRPGPTMILTGLLAGTAGAVLIQTR